MCVFDETGHHFYAKENYLGGKVLWLEKSVSGPHIITIMS